MADQNVNIKATVIVNDDQVKKYNEELDKTAKKSEEAFNPKKALRAATLELQQAQTQFGEYSSEALKAAQRVAQLRDNINEANETAALFDPGKKFAAFSGALNSVTAGYGAVQGAIGLLGVESDKVQQQLLKVQSALAVSEGLSTILDSGKDFARLGAIIKNQVVTAFSTLRSAIISTGIGALVVALGVIVANWDKIKGAISGVSKEQENLNKATADNTKKQQEKLDAISGQENILKLQGKSERDILELKVKQTDEVIAATEEQIRQSEVTLKFQTEAEKRNKDILTGILRFLTAPTQLVVDLFSKVASLAGVDFKFDIAEFTASLVFDPNEVATEGQKAIDEQKKVLEKLKNDRAGYQLSIQGIDKKAAEDAAERRKKELEEIERIEGESLERRRRQADEETQELIRRNEQRAKDRSQFIEDESNAIVKGADTQLKAFGAAAAERQRIEANLAAEQEARQRGELQREEEKQKAIAMTGSALTSLADLVGRQTAAGKALAIASSLINTFQGITQIWANKTVIPEPFGTIQKVAATVTAAASGFAAVRGIVRTPVPGGGGGGGAAVPSGVGGAAPLSPSLPQAIQTTLDQTSINSITNQPTRAYVVESDVSSSQERIRRINRAATFG